MMSIFFFWSFCPAARNERFKTLILFYIFLLCGILGMGVCFCFCIFFCPFPIPLFLVCLFCFWVGEAKIFFFAFLERR